jgi:hypothetical protein
VPEDYFEYKLVDRLIKESTLAARLYLGLSSILLTLAVALLVLSLARSSAESIEKIISGVVALFGAIPLPLFLSARAQRVGLVSLKERWEDAKKNKNDVVIQQLTIKFDQLQDRVIEKGLGLSK